MLVLLAVLSGGVLPPAFLFVTRIDRGVDYAIFRGWEALDGFLGKPTQQMTQAPVTGTQQTTDVPFSDMHGRRACHVLEALDSWGDDLHEQHPTEDELVTVTEDTGQSPQQNADEQGQTTQWQQGMIPS